MIKVDRCVLCGSKRQRVLITHSYSRPHTKGQAQLSYVDSRLEILFDHIWEGGDVAEFDVVLCGACGIIFSNPRYTDAEITTKYKAIGQMQSDRVRKAGKNLALAEAKAAEIHRVVSNMMDADRAHGPKRILDYGGAGGMYISPFIPAGHHCFLLDYVAYPLPEKVTRLGKDLADLDENARFDVILLLHVLEHCTGPTEMIAKLSRYLADDGLLYVEVPLGCWREWKHLKEPLTHVNFFSEQSLCNCVSNVGLDVAHLSTKFQYAVVSRSLCVNLIARKSAPQANITFKSTRRQMSQPVHRLRSLVQQLAGKALLK